MPPRLRRVDCSAPGIARRRAGKGFAYYEAGGARVTDPETVERIKALVIPPAWTDVWICTDPRGHIQATGLDAKGRRQYRYHDGWRIHRDREKFDHMLEFARAMPSVRRCVAAHLSGEGLARERVLACAVRLLDLGFFRIGTEGYAEENQTYGLATMQRHHVRVSGEEIVFDYVAKSQKRRVQSVVDPEVMAVIQSLKRRRGGPGDLLVRKDGRRWVDVRSADINAYIKDCTGGDFTAKDFRAWNANVLAATALAVSAAVTSGSGRKRAVTRAVKEVSHYLGNTPAVCRSSYIDPRVIDRFREGRTIAPALDVLATPSGTRDNPGGSLLTQGAIEGAVIDLLDDRPAVDEEAA